MKISIHSTQLRALTIDIRFKEAKSYSDEFNYVIWFTSKLLLFFLLESQITLINLYGTPFFFNTYQKHSVGILLYAFANVWLNEINMAEMQTEIRVRMRINSTLSSVGKKE